MEPVVQVRHLSKFFKEIKAVNDISFSVNRGEVYGFLGQNGAGKSTAIRMLLTLIEPTAGKIEIFGKDLQTHRKQILREVGAIIERPDLYKYLTAYENLSLFAKMSGVSVSKKELMDQLQLVGLKERAFSKVKTYSQGMKQRLGIAVALVHQPQLIVLDEPTNGLDPQGIADVRNLILHLSKKQGRTILVSSHLLNEMEMIADRMLILDKGKKLVEGSVKELFDPAKSLLEIQVNNPETTLSGLSTTRWSAFMKESRDGHIVFQLMKQEIPFLTRDLVNMGAEIVALLPKHSLEDYFLSLTTGNQHVDAFEN